MSDDTHLSRNRGDLRWWLALQRAPSIGSKSFIGLLDRFGSPEAVFRSDPQVWRDAGLGDRTKAWLGNPDWSAVDKDLAWLDNPNCHCLLLDDPLYPPLLREIPDPPPLLFVVGTPSALTFRHIAVVGSRNPTFSGRQIAKELSSALAREGLGVVSGLALGIDAAGHRGALEVGGTTVAVAGCGPDRIYPPQHRNLAAEIVRNQGALVSEFTPGTEPLAGNFPRRNRIISGLCIGTLVIEAAEQSGSLITARLALEQGREVFAVPGSIYSPLARGCNDLIKQGAKLVQTVGDILEEFAFRPQAVLPVRAEPEPVHSKDGHLGLLKYVAYDPTSVDTLVAATGNGPEFIAAMLLLLELEGYVASAPGGCYIRLK